MLTSTHSLLTTGYQTYQAIRYAEPWNGLFEGIYFTYGYIGANNLIRTYWHQERELCERYQDLSPKQQKLHKTIDLMGNISCILYGLKSQPLVPVWRWMAIRLLPPACLLTLSTSPFGMLITSVAVALTLPTTIRTTYRVICWSIHYIQRAYL